MELNIITVAFITGVIIIYAVSLIFYIQLIMSDWRKKSKLTKKEILFIVLFGAVPLVNTCILLYAFFNKSSE